MRRDFGNFLSGPSSISRKEQTLMRAGANDECAEIGLRAMRNAHSHLRLFRAI